MKNLTTYIAYTSLEDETFYLSYEYPKESPNVLNTWFKNPHINYIFTVCDDKVEMFTKNKNIPNRGKASLTDHFQFVILDVRQG